MKTIFLILAFLFSRNIIISQSGMLDASFCAGVSLDSYVQTIAVQSDGKILVGGSFTSFNGVSSNQILRLTADGVEDASFSIGTGFDDLVQTIAVQSDGKILVGGSFTSFNGVSSPHIIRLNQDGSIDNSFSINSGFNNNVKQIVIQSDGKILVCGSFSSYNMVSSYQMVRLNQDGSIDSGFTTNSGFLGGVFTICSQSGNKILVGGSFTSYNGTITNRIIRLNQDGSIDNSFVSMNGFDATVTTITFDFDGKILVGGNFTSYNGTTANRIIRLNQNGAYDNTFICDFDNNVQSIEVQNNDKILVGGNFIMCDGETRNKIARLNQDGTIDSGFNIGGGFNSGVNDMCIQSDGKILVGGYFTNYDGATRNNIARIFGDCVSNTGVDAQMACSSYTWIDGTTYTSSTSAPQYTLTNINGCDSVVTLNLTIALPSQSNMSHAICQGEAFVFFDQTLSSSGNYTYITTNSEGCDSTINLSLVVNPVPIPTILQETNNVLTTDMIFNTYQWFNNGNIIINETSQILQITESSSYTVTVTNEFGCSATSSPFFGVYSNTANTIAIDKENISISPNPSEGLVMVRIPNANDIDLKIFYSSGVLIFARHEKGDSVLLDMTLQAKGAYILETNGVYEKIFIK